MTPIQIELARHALGLPNKRRCSYRNHFVAGAGHPDFEEWQAMVAEGKARTRAGSALSGGGSIFWLTVEGAKESLKPRERLDPEDFPKVTT